jgi:predicted phage gp36 major capsid-like protein
VPRFTTSFSDEQDVWLAEQAEERNRSKAEIIRWCVDQVRTGAVNTGSVQSGEQSTTAVNDLHDRVGELEARLAELEKLNQQSGSETADMLVKDETADAVESADREASGGASSTAQPQGSDGEKQVVQWVREHGPVSRSEIIDEFSEAWETSEITADTWWRNYGRPALAESECRYRNGVGWRKE